MDDTITLEQHWYGSAPIGLELPRGLQTIAHSAGLAGFAALKSHSVYKPPPGTPEKDMPCNWGWFWLDADRACVHRIAYSGTDELGRPGNYLAHNLVVSRADLEKIDCDIPALIRWLRTPPPEGPDPGLLTDYPQVYRALDPGKDRPDKARLRSAPPLLAPVERLRDIRRRVDGDWAGQFFEPLCDAFGAPFLSGILRALLSRPEQRKPLLVIGAGDGTNEADLELKVVEFLFALLPFHCRRRLSFATFDHLPGALFSNAPAQGSLPPHRARRLLFTPSKMAPRLPGGDAPAWFWHTGTGQSGLPDEPNWVIDKIDKLLTGHHGDLLALRELANGFAFEDEFEGMADALKLRDGESAPPEPADAELFTRACATARDRALPFLLRMASRLLPQAHRLLGDNAKAAVGLTRSYVGLLIRAGAGGVADPAAGQHLPLLFRWATQPNRQDLFGLLLRRFGQSPELAHLREQSVQDFTAAIGAADPGQVELFLEKWNEVSNEFGEEPGCQTFLIETARPLFRLLERANRLKYPLDKKPTEVILPIMKRLPVEGLEQLEWEMDLLSRVSRRDARPGGELLASWLRNGGLPRPLLEQLSTLQRVVLRFYREWLVADGLTNGRFAELLADPRLLDVYAEPPLVPGDELPHRGLVAFLERIVAGKEARPGRRDYVAAYVERGAARLRRQLQHQDTDGGHRAFSLGYLLWLSRAHCKLMNLVWDSPPRDAAPHDHAGSLLADHLADLLAFLLAHGCEEEKGQDQLSKCVLDGPLDLLVRWQPHVEGRVAMMEATGRRLAGLCPSQKTDGAPPLFPHLARGLRERNVEAVESAWHVNNLWQRMCSPDAPPPELRARVAVIVLTRDPDLAAPKGAEMPFGAWLAGHLDGAVWQRLAEKIERDCTGENWQQEARQWLPRNSQRRPLLDQLGQQGLLSWLGDRLVARHGGEGCEPLHGLTYLLLLTPPPELGEPIRQRLGKRLIPRLQQFGGESDCPSPAEFRRQVKELCPALCAVDGSTVPPDLLRRFWKQLARALVVFARDKLRVGDLFHEIIYLGLARAEELAEEPERIWGDLFAETAAAVVSGSLEASSFNRLFVQAGESAVRVGSEGAVAGLLGVRERKEFHCCFWEEPQVVRVLSLSKPQPRDLLHEALCEPLSAVRGGRLESDEAIEAVLGRARLTRAVYAKEPVKAAVALRDIGVPADASREGRGVPFRVPVTALALYGYLTPDASEDQECLSKRLEEVTRTPFWKAFYKLTSEQGREICLTLERYVSQRSVKSHDAAHDMTRPLWKAYGIKIRK